MCSSPPVPRKVRRARHPLPVDGIDLRYDISGDGPALVLLHGSVLTRAIWRGLGYLAPLIAEHTVIRIDLAAMGSPEPRMTPAPTPRRCSSPICSPCSTPRAWAGRR